MSDQTTEDSRPGDKHTKVGEGSSYAPEIKRQCNIISIALIIDVNDAVQMMCPDRTSYLTDLKHETNNKNSLQSGFIRKMKNNISKKGNHNFFHEKWWSRMTDLSLIN